MKHYVEGPHYSTSENRATAQPFRFQGIARATQSVLALHDTGNRIAEQQEQKMAQQRAEADRKAADFDRGVALAESRQVESALNQQAVMELRQRQNEERIAKLADDRERYQKEIDAYKAKESAKQEKDFNTAWGRDQMALFKADVSDMKGFYKTMYSDKQVRDLMNNQGYEMYDPWTGGWT